MKPQWRIFDAKTRKERQGLALEQVVSFLMELDPGEWETTFVWKPGFSGWRKPADCEEIQSRLQPPAPPAPPVIETKASPGVTAEPRASAVQPPPFRAQPAESSQRWEDRRKHTRVTMRLKVVIVAGNRSFRSFTKDVSLGGFLLEKPLPWNTPPKHCHVFISGPQGELSIEFRARAVLTDGDNRFRVAFEEIDERFHERLATWITEAQKRFAAQAA